VQEPNKRQESEDYRRGYEKPPDEEPSGRAF
jgi:hypothetical protein